MRALGKYAAIVLLVGTASTANAYDYGYGSGGLWPWFGHGNQGPAAYALGNIPAPPYFALHPPVYYSHQITPRSYGRSPFACSCDCHGAQAVATRVIVNPHVRVQKPAEPAEQTARVALAPRIENPFYYQQVAERP